MRSSQAFYGAPLVAWTPALGASVYEVQWSKKAYPFKPEPNPQNDNASGRSTLGTSMVLPLKPGTWYYRVRGFNYSLPTGAQQMSWSDPGEDRRREAEVQIVKTRQVTRLRTKASLSLGFRIQRFALNVRGRSPRTLIGGLVGRLSLPCAHGRFAAGTHPFACG